MTSIYSDENLRDLNERLGAADELVKQHIKVAEEAISGTNSILQVHHISHPIFSRNDVFLSTSLWLFYIFSFHDFGFRITVLGFKLHILIHKCWFSRLGEGQI